jgi:hypothetical protein
MVQASGWAGALERGRRKILKRELRRELSLVRELRGEVERAQAVAMVEAKEGELLRTPPSPHVPHLPLSCALSALPRGHNGRRAFTPCHVYLFRIHIYLKCSGLLSPGAIGLAPGGVRVYRASYLATPFHIAFWHVRCGCSTVYRPAAPTEKFCFLYQGARTVVPTSTHFPVDCSYFTYLHLLTPIYAYFHLMSERGL